MIVYDDGHDYALNQNDLKSKSRKIMDLKFEIIGV